MRRLLKEVAAGGEVKGDVTTLEDFGVLAKLKEKEEGEADSESRCMFDVNDVAQVSIVDVDVEAVVAVGRPAGSARLRINLTLATACTIETDI